MNKKKIYIVLGALMILGTAFNPDFPDLTDWSSSRQAGNNVGVMIIPIIGIYLMVRGFRKK